jgi:predicted lipopolysaccharide heptosyltransferase III
VDLNGKHILIVKLRYIGDTLSIVPVVENLKRKAPESLVDVLVNRGTEPVVIHHPDIRNTWVYDYRLSKRAGYRSLRYQLGLFRRLRRCRYDVVIDFTHGDRAAVISFLTGAPVRVTHAHAGTLSQWLMNRFADSDPAAHHIVDHQLASLEELGLDGLEPTTSLHVPAPVRRAVERRIEAAELPGGRPWVAVHPGARGELRRWRGERFAELIERLRAETSAAVLLVGGPGEEAVLEAVQARLGRPTDLCSCDLGLLELGELLRRCALFVGNDSAPGHLAAAAGCPTVSLFGPTFPHMWRPLGRRGEVLFKDPPCCGCRQEACARPDAWCMDLIGVDEVWRAVLRLLGAETGSEGKAGAL